jgi:molybdenum-dependent DNA-binding transcriptional regulator ModE
MRKGVKAGTKKADAIHEYYIKLEETLHEVVQDESAELKLQLEQNQLQLDKSEKTAEKNREYLNIGFRPTTGLIGFIV